MANIVNMDEVSKFEELKEALEKGGVIAFPTETVYGLCCKFDSVEGFEKIAEIKGRDVNKPCQVMTHSLEFFEKYTNVNSNELRVANRFMPGPLTLIVHGKKDMLPAQAVNKDYGVGVRIPKYDKLLNLLKYLDFPVLTTSVNKSGEKPLEDVFDIVKDFGPRLDAILVDDDIVYSDIPSTVCDLTNGQVKIIRKGSITLEDIERVILRNREIKTIYIGNDNGAYETKLSLMNHLVKEGYNVVNLGCDTLDRVDYPDYAFAVSEKVAKDPTSRGIVICKSGEGVSIAANKVKGIRCGICYNKEVAEKIVQHNNCNVAAFGASYFTEEEIAKMCDIYLCAEFEGGRHQRRIDKIDNYVNKQI